MGKRVFVNVNLVKNKVNPKMGGGTTKRAPDWWDSAAFSTPEQNLAPKPSLSSDLQQVTQTVML